MCPWGKEEERGEWRRKSQRGGKPVMIIHTGKYEKHTDWNDLQIIQIMESSSGLVKKPKRKSKRARGWPQKAWQKRWKNQSESFFEFLNISEWYRSRTLHFLIFFTEYTLDKAKVPNPQFFYYTYLTCQKRLVVTPKYKIFITQLLRFILDSSLQIFGLKMLSKNKETLNQEENLHSEKYQIESGSSLRKHENHFKIN